jgi:hypothetical protein
MGSRNGLNILEKRKTLTHARNQTYVIKKLRFAIKLVQKQIVGYIHWIHWNFPGQSNCISCWKTVNQYPHHQGIEYICCQFGSYICPGPSSGKLLHRTFWKLVLGTGNPLIQVHGWRIWCVAARKGSVKRVSELPICDPSEREIYTGDRELRFAFSGCPVNQEIW